MEHNSYGIEIRIKFYCEFKDRIFFVSFLSTLERNSDSQFFTVHESKPIQECLPKIITEKFDF